MILLHRPLPVDLPEFRIFLPTDTSRLAKDSRFSCDLRRAVNITKAEGKVFHSLAEILLDDDERLQSGSFDANYFTFQTPWTSLVDFLSLILAVIAFIGVIFLAFRVKLIAATLAFMHVIVHQVAAVHPTIPSFMSFTPFISSNASSPSPTVTYVQTCQPQSSLFSLHYTIILCVILLVLLLFKKFRRCTSNPNSCSLLLEFGSNSSLVFCQTVPGSPTQYSFTASKFIDHVEVCGRLKPLLLVSWSSLRIHNNHLNMSFE